MAAVAVMSLHIGLFCSRRRLFCNYTERVYCTGEPAYDNVEPVVLYTALLLFCNYIRLFCNVTMQRQ